MSRTRRSNWTLLPLLALALVLTVTMWTGCGNERMETVSGPDLANPSLEFTVDHPSMRTVMEVQDRHTPDLFQVEGVVGTATTLNEVGEPVIVVYLAKALPNGIISESFDGVEVVTEVTGVFRAMKTTTTSHTAKQVAPIQLGTSGGWRYDLANGYCCGGTLGSLVLKSGTQYVMSNYHVLEADIVSGGNSRVATAGDPVIQPGLIDVGCNAANAQNVATLSGIKSLPGSNVDVAIAAVTPGMVRTDGAILEVGTISATTVAASVGQLVKKSGRTTGLTRSSVTGLNATVSIAYENECAGGAAFTKTFTGQIVVKNLRSKFLAGGDSGSLMVQDVTTSPKAIGLLFAGSSTTAIANPISSVLSFLNATMVGN